MHIGGKIKAEIEAKGVSVTDFAKKIGKTRGNMHKIFNKENIDTRLLQQIAKELSVPVYTFFDDVLPGNNQSIQGNGNVAAYQSNVTLSDKDKEIEHLRELLAEKEARLADKEKVIELLSSQIKP